jgi:hypothetical protein
MIAPPMMITRKNPRAKTKIPAIVGHLLCAPVRRKVKGSPHCASPLSTPPYTPRGSRSMAAGVATLLSSGLGVCFADSLLVAEVLTAPPWLAARKTKSRAASSSVWTSLDPDRCLCQLLERNGCAQRPKAPGLQDTSECAQTSAQPLREETACQHWPRPTLARFHDYPDCRVFPS